MVYPVPVQIESRVSAEVAGEINPSELKRLLHAKTREALIDFYRANPVILGLKEDPKKNPLRIQVSMTTEKIGDITRFKFYVPATASSKPLSISVLKTCVKEGINEDRSTEISNQSKFR